MFYEMIFFRSPRHFPLFGLLLQPPLLPHTPSGIEVQTDNLLPIIIFDSLFLVESTNNVYGFLPRLGWSGHGAKCAPSTLSRAYFYSQLDCVCTRLAICPQFNRTELSTGCWSTSTNSTLFQCGCKQKAFSWRTVDWDDYGVEAAADAAMSVLVLVLHEKRPRTE